MSILQDSNSILARIKAGIKENVYKDEGSIVHDVASPVSIELEMAYMYAEDILRKAFPQTSYDEYLDMRVAEFGVFRKSGIKATGRVQFTGTNGTIISVGTKVLTSDGLVYLTTKQASIVGGSALVDVIGEEVGERYNIPIGVINIISNPIDGLFSVTNSVEIAGGVNAESDKDLLERFLYKVKSPASSGNIYDYEFWALEVPGIGGAIVTPAWSGGGTVKVTCIGEDSRPINAGKVLEVKTYIDNIRPIGAVVTVDSATVKNISINVSVKVALNYTLEEVKTNISKGVEQYLKEIAFKENTVSYARIGNIVYSSLGVADYSGLKVNSGIVNITIGKYEVAILSGVVANEI